MKNIARATIASLILGATALSGTAMAATNNAATGGSHGGHRVGEPHEALARLPGCIGARKMLANKVFIRFTETGSIGKTTEGRPHLMAIVTSPENHRNLAKYKDISKRLAMAEGLTGDQARALAREGKAVVWIDGGLHATEVLGAHQLLETSYQFVSKTDDETMRILNDVIILFVHANPDGNDLTAEWYMRNPNPQQRGSGPGIPKLYQKYIGHDNNRDFFGSTQPETENMNRVMYREWYPQIVYNHHQTGPAGTVMFAPPFRDPFNYNFDPLIPVGIDLVPLRVGEGPVVDNVQSRWQVTGPHIDLMREIDRASRRHLGLREVRHLRRLR